MKKTYFIFIFLLLLIAIVSCTRKMLIPQSCMAAPAGDTVIFSSNHAINLFAPCRKDIQATLTKIMDSRCPKGVDCIWAGTVGVELTLNNASVITLTVGKQNMITYHEQHYAFTLVDVVPYPGTSSAAPTAIIRIIKTDQ